MSQPYERGRSRQIGLNNVYDGEEEDFDDCREENNGELKSIYEPLIYPENPDMSEAARAERAKLTMRVRDEQQRYRQESLETAGASMRRLTTREAEAEYKSLRNRFIPGLPGLAAQIEGRAAPRLSGIGEVAKNLDRSGLSSAAPERGWNRPLHHESLYNSQQSATPTGVRKLTSKVRRRALYNPFREYAHRRLNDNLRRQPSDTDKALRSRSGTAFDDRFRIESYPNHTDSKYMNNNLPPITDLHGIGGNLNIQQQVPEPQFTTHHHSSEDFHHSLYPASHIRPIDVDLHSREQASESEFHPNSKHARSLSPDIESTITLPLSDNDKEFGQQDSGIEDNLDHASESSAVAVLENLINWRHPAAEDHRSQSPSPEVHNNEHVKFQAITAAIKDSEPEFGNRDFIASPEITSSVVEAVRSRVRESTLNTRVGPRTSISGTTRNQRLPNMGGGFSMRALAPSHPHGKSSTSTPRAGHGPIPPPMAQYSVRAASNVIRHAYDQTPLAPASSDETMEEGPQRPAAPELILPEMPIQELFVESDELPPTYNMRNLHEHISNIIPGSTNDVRIIDPAVPQWQMGIGNLYSWLTEMVGAEIWNDVLFVNRSEYGELVQNVIDSVHFTLRNRYRDYYRQISDAQYNSHVMTQTANSALQEENRTLQSRIADLEGRAALQEAAIQNKLTSVFPPGIHSDLRAIGRPDKVNMEESIHSENTTRRPSRGRSNSAPLLSNHKPVAVSTDHTFENQSSFNGEVGTESMHLRGGQAGIYEGVSDDEDEDEADARPNYSVPAQWGTYTAQAQQRTGTSAHPTSERSIISQPTVFDGPLPKYDAYAASTRVQDEYTLARHRPDQVAATTEPTYSDVSGNHRRSYSVYSQDRESESGRSLTKKVNTLNPDAPEHTPLAATFRSSSVYNSFDDNSGVSTPLNAPNVRFATPSTVTELDPRMENPELDIEAGVRANFPNICEMYRGLSDTRPIKTYFSETETSVHVPKIDERVMDLDRFGNSIGNVQQPGKVKKALKERHLELVRERDEQMLRATAEVRAWNAMDPEERAERLAILRNPIDFWHGEAGAALEDNFEFDEIPHVYTHAVSNQEIEAWMQRIDIADAAENDESFQSFNDEHDIVDEGVLDNSNSPNELYGAQLDSFNTSKARNNALPSRTQPSSRKRRSKKQIDQLASDLLAVNLNRRSCSRSINSSRRQREISQLYPCHSVTTDLALLDDSLIVPDIKDTTVDLSQDLTSEEALNNIVRCCTNARAKGRLVVVQLDPLVHFTPAAITKRVFGGVVQDIAFYEAQRKAVIIFMHCAEAKAFVNHVQKVKKSGTAQEKRALQINADWYQGSETESICPPQENIAKHYFSSKATRVLILHGIPLTKKKEEVNKELGLRLNQLLVSVCLITPQQNYLKQQKGKTAIIEFTSIKDAIEARQSIIDGNIEEYGHTNPKFAADPASNPDIPREYCHCKGCNDRRDLRSRVS